MLASNLVMDFRDVIPYRHTLEQHFTYLMKRFFYLRFCGTLILFNHFEVISSGLHPPPFPGTIIHTVLFTRQKTTICNLPWSLCYFNYCDLMIPPAGLIRSLPIYEMCTRVGLEGTGGDSRSIKCSLSCRARVYLQNLLHGRRSYFRFVQG
jgi:hypothetical protein